MNGNDQYLKGNAPPGEGAPYLAAICPLRPGKGREHQRLSGGSFPGELFKIRPEPAGGTFPEVAPPVAEQDEQAPFCGFSFFPFRKDGSLQGGFPFTGAA